MVPDRAGAGEMNRGERPGRILRSVKGASPDGKTKEAEYKPARTTWSEAETHASQSSGEIHALLVELKAKPAKKM